MRDDLTPPPPPWAERPRLDLDLDRPIRQLAADLPPDVLAAGPRLLEAILPAIPRSARLAADWVRLRTAGRFQRDRYLAWVR